MIPDWVPNIHPLLIHFPIAILIIAVVFDVLALVAPNKWWHPTTATILYAIGTVSTFVAYYSGQEAGEYLKLSKPALEVLNHHSQLALYTLLFFSFYITVRLALTWNRDTIKRALHIGLIIGAFAGLGLLYATAEHGGELVYGYGVGTGQLLHTQKSDNSK